MADDTDTDRKEMIAQFCDVTGVPNDRATFYLESANWTLQIALAHFYEDDNTEDENMAINNDDDLPAGGDAAAAAAMSAAFSSASGTEKTSDTTNERKVDNKSKTPAPRPRIATIHNMTKSSSSDDEEQGQAFYTGTAHSGQQILGPPKKNPNKDYVSEVFRSAQESGAEVVEQAHTSASAAGAALSFHGTGYRLGQTDDDHVVLPGQRSSRSQNTEPVILKLWRQGFSINDGELRGYEEPTNKQFLESIMKGEIPQELRQKGDTMVHVELEDHRHEEFVKPIQKIKPFAGKGQTLGSPAPEVNTTALQQTSAVTSETNTQNEARAAEQLAVDANQPTTMIQVRLADSSRLSARFNHSHTVADLQTYIITARPQYASQNFALLTTFPSRELSDATQTIEKAGLLNAAIIQRFK